MAAVAAQAYKKRNTHLVKTDAMMRAERQNGVILDRVWKKYKAQDKKDRKTSTTPSSNTQSTPLLKPKISHHTLLDAEEDGSIYMKSSLKRNEETLTTINGDLTDVFDESMLVMLNIGGTLFTLLLESIRKASYQDGFLSKFIQLTHKDRLKVADAYFSENRAYYFQRSPSAFDCIFQYYAHASAFSAELEFWRLPQHAVGSCCSDSVTSITHNEKLLEGSDQEENADKLFEQSHCRFFRRRLWTFLERPNSSTHAKAFELVATLFVVISVTVLSFGTIPDYQVSEFVLNGNISVRMPNGRVLTKPRYTEIRSEHPMFLFVERICIAFFTIEYSLRLFATYKKLRFIVKPLNLVDLLAIIPFYLELFLTVVGVDETKLRDLRWAFLVVRILRVLRVIRIIKLGRFSSGLQTFAATLQRSQKQLQMMAIVLLTGVVFFSTLIYFLEKDEKNSPFTSIPAAYWWCIVTMTTVGYGDIVPNSTMGKVIASVAIMCGVLVLALPITIIVDNFIKVAQEEQQLEQLKNELMARREREWQKVLVNAVEHTTTASIVNAATERNFSG